ncbi:MAG: hypothetical protein ACYTDY_07210, partial [Planctomycetota bacterium]
SCTGLAGAACPDDVVADTDTVCRPSVGVCDADDFCPGVPGDPCGDDLKVDCSFVTDSSLCPFDVYPDKGVCVDDATGLPTAQFCDLADGDPGCDIGATCEESRDFRLLFPPDVQNWVAYKLVASNPGQYFYNLVVEGTPNTTVPVDISIAYPFVTQGAMPVHVYDAVDLAFDDDGCFLPPDTALASFSQIITIDDWVNGTTPNGGSTLDCDPICGPDGAGSCTFTVQVPLYDSGQSYVNVHLDYGLKGMDIDANVCDGTPDRYDRGTQDPDFGGWDALENTATDDGPLALSNCKTYEFEHVCVDCNDASPMGDQVTSLNEFKREAGALGFVQGLEQKAVPNAEVILYRNSTNEIIESATTDEDGYYITRYKHTGPPDNFTVILIDYGLNQVVRLHGNGWAEVNFDVHTGSVTGDWWKKNGSGGKRW